jgi:hypothetical protein
VVRVIGDPLIQSRSVEENTPADSHNRNLATVDARTEGALGHAEKFGSGSNPEESLRSGECVLRHVGHYGVRLGWRGALPVRVRSREGCEPLLTGDGDANRYGGADLRAML